MFYKPIDAVYLCRSMRVIAARQPFPGMARMVHDCLLDVQVSLLTGGPFQHAALLTVPWRTANQDPIHRATDYPRRVRCDLFRKKVLWWGVNGGDLSAQEASTSDNRCRDGSSHELVMRSAVSGWQCLALMKTFDLVRPCPAEINLWQRQDPQDGKRTCRVHRSKTQVPTSG